MKNLLRFVVLLTAVFGALVELSAQTPRNGTANSSSRSDKSQKQSYCDDISKDGTLIVRVVRLKIILLSTGDVGPVSLVKKKDWRCRELAEKAIAAAKKIKFEPKLVDGRPVNSTVIREYTFTLLEDPVQK